MKLTPNLIKAISKPGRYADGKGLYLQVSRNGAKSWIFRYQLAGRRREMGLGGYRDAQLGGVGLTLAQARKELETYSRQVRAGIDPLEEKRERLRAGAEEARRESAAKMTFRRCAEAFIESKRPGWRNPKHGQQWTNTLTKYAYPVIGKTPVADVTRDQVLEILTPIWTTKTETATRVRNRIELVLDYATSLEYRNGDNPARWKGHLENLLPAPNKIRKPKHLSALPFSELPGVYAELCKFETVGATALRFVILTACRSGDVRGATWSEIIDDLWIIPGERMKAGREHRVPLTAEALAVLDTMDRGTHYIFPGRKGGKISDMTMTKFLRSVREGITVHGFRSTFRDWAAEKTHHPEFIAEMALAHTVGNAVERAYRRSDLLAKRRTLMKDWTDFVTGATSGQSVIELRSGGTKSAK